MGRNIRWITILSLLALCLACAWGGVLFSQNLIDGLDTEEEAERDDDRRVERVEDDFEVTARERDEDDDDDDEVSAGASNDDDAGETEVENGLTGTVPVSPNTDNPARLAEISAAEAEQIALEEEPEAQLEELGLEVENGYLVYEVELTNGMEIIVDAGNGDILQTKTDD